MIRTIRSRLTTPLTGQGRMAAVPDGVVIPGEQDDEAPEVLWMWPTTAW